MVLALHDSGSGRMMAVHTSTVGASEERVAAPSSARRETVAQQAVLALIEDDDDIRETMARKLRRSGYEDLLSSGIVITGGSSSMQGMVELGEGIFHMPVRIGQPQYHGALSEVVRNPRYATAVGLLLLGVQQQRQHQLAQAGIGTLQALIERMKSWFKGNF